MPRRQAPQQGVVPEDRPENEVYAALIHNVRHRLSFSTAAERIISLPPSHQAHRAAALVRAETI